MRVRPTSLANPRESDSKATILIPEQLHDGVANVREAVVTESPVEPDFSLGHRLPARLNQIEYTGARTSGLRGRLGPSTVEPVRVMPA